MMPLPAELRTDIATVDPRAAARRTLRLRVRTSSTSSGMNALIHNLSENGLLIETAVSLELGETLYVDLPDTGPTPAAIVWNRGTLFGCEFHNWIPASAVSAALLRASPERLIGDESPSGQLSDFERRTFEHDNEHTPSQLWRIGRVILVILLSVSIAFALLSFALQ